MYDNTDSPWSFISQKHCHKLGVQSAFTPTCPQEPAQWTKDLLILLTIRKHGAKVSRHGLRKDSSYFFFAEMRNWGPGKLRDFSKVPEPWYPAWKPSSLTHRNAFELPVMVNLDGQPDRNDRGDTPLGVSVGPSQGGLTETGRLVSNVNSTAPGAGVLD